MRIAQDDRVLGTRILAQKPSPVGTIGTKDTPRFQPSLRDYNMGGILPPWSLLLGYSHAVPAGLIVALRRESRSVRGLLEPVGEGLRLTRVRIGVQTYGATDTATACASAENCEAYDLFCRNLEETGEREK